MKTTIKILLLLVLITSCKKSELIMEIQNISNSQTIDLDMNGNKMKFNYTFTNVLDKRTSFETSDSCYFFIKENGVIIMQHRGLNYTFKSKRKIEN